LRNRGKKKQPYDLVLYFDACASRLKPCTNSCRNNKEYMCRHRLRSPNPLIFRHSGELSFLHLSDFQVILDFIWKLTHTPPKLITPKTKFFIVTRDKNFLRDAENGWDAKRKKRTQPKLSFNQDLRVVQCNSFIIKIITTHSDSVVDLIKTINNVLPRY